MQDRRKFQGCGCNRADDSCGGVCSRDERVHEYTYAPSPPVAQPEFVDWKSPCCDKIMRDDTAHYTCPCGKQYGSSMERGLFFIGSIPVAPPIEARTGEQMATEWLTRECQTNSTQQFAQLMFDNWADMIDLLTAYYAACRQPDIAEERRKERAGIMAALRIICVADSWGAALGECLEGEPEIAALIQKVRSAKVGQPEEK